MQKTAETPVRYLKGVGPARAAAFEKSGIDTVEDLLYYFPRRYEDRSDLIPIKDLKDGEVYTIRAKVVTSVSRQTYSRRTFSITEITAADLSGKIKCVWFNQPYLKNYFKEGAELILYGKVEKYSGSLQMSAPEFELVSGEEDELLSVGRIVPVYTLPAKASQRSMRAVIRQALDEFLPRSADFLDFTLRSRHALLNLSKALVNIHFPENESLQKQAYERLSFEEFFLFQIPLALRKKQKKERQGISHQTEGALLDNFLAGLPFQLTYAQKMVLDEIRRDMALPRPMQRLLQGDVGSGKTVVATAAAVMAIQGGWQAALMVPTEILAKQHYAKIGLQLKGVRIGLLTSGLKSRERQGFYRKIKEGELDLVIGTHALLEEGLEFKRLGLVVIDEQHKFGVGQRALLPQKGLSPDVLIMTATPIPRTLSITIYGDLDISVINELPPGRLAVQTRHFIQKERAKAYQAVRGELRKGHQAYIIYPVIEESFALDIAGAEKMYRQLQRGEFKDFKLGLVHGRLKEGEQERVMSEFNRAELDILVATTVLEVGIDIPNATCMVIEHAERFGLAQLHQLRGRVGRSAEQSFCLLVSDAQTAESSRRLKAMVDFRDGFRIAEEDLKIRGPGEFFGSRQHGLSELRIGNPLAQLQLLKRARQEALRLVADDAQLSLREHAALKLKLLRRFPEYEKLIVVA